MSEILIASRDNKQLFEIEQISRQKGFRPKLTFQLDKALEWLKLFDFDVVIVDQSFSEEEIGALTGHLWEKNPEGLMLCTGASKASTGRYELMGAEDLNGENWKELLADRLNDVRVQKEKSRGNVSLNVLLVEDLDSPRDIISTYLEGLGPISVHGEASARQALQTLEMDPERFNCVITDLRMPEMSGLQLIELLRKHPKLQRLPVIVLTAYGTADTLIECLRAGASGFLVKPPKKHDLKRELARAARIVRGTTSPRLATATEAESLRAVLNEKGFV